jgi:hypothetical protein
MSVVRFNSFSFTPLAPGGPAPSPVVSAFGVRQDAFEYAGSSDDLDLIAYLSQSYTDMIWNGEGYDTVVILLRTATVDGDTLSVQDYSNGEPDGDPDEFELTEGCLVTVVMSDVLSSGPKGTVGILSSDPNGVWRCDEYGRPFDVNDLQAP